MTAIYSAYNPTWKYSANPALVIADHLLFPDAGWDLVFDDLRWDTFVAAANYFDRYVAGFGDRPEPYARCHTTWSASEEKRDILARLKAACDCDVYEDNDGKIVIWPSQWEEPTVTFTKADFASFKIDPGGGVYDESNVVQVTYVEPRTNFTKNTSIVVRDEASIAQVGQRQSTVDLSCIHSFSQAYRIATRAMRRKNSPQKISGVLKTRGLLADGQRVVRLDIPEWGIVGVYRVLSMNVPNFASVSLSLALVTPDMFDDVVPPYDPVNPFLPGLPTIPGFTPIAPTIETVFGTVSETTGTITASVDTPTGAGDAQCIAYFRSRPVAAGFPPTPLGDGHWTVWGESLGQFSAKSPPITGVADVDQQFEVQSWLVSTQGVAGPASASSFVTLHF